jgi:hypothetical protein
MADDLSNRGPRDRSRVNIHEDWEVRWWCSKWGISAETLRSAVKTVGVMAADVARHLGKSL